MDRPALGFPVFAEDAVTYGPGGDKSGDKTWILNIKASAAVVGAIILASLVMIAAKQSATWIRAKRG